MFEVRVEARVEVRVEVTVEARVEVRISGNTIKYVFDQTSIRASVLDP